MSQVLLECGYSPPETWKLLPEWLQDLITGSGFAQLLASPPLIERDCSETQSDSVIAAYRRAHTPALWPEICENASVWRVCVDQPVPDWSALSLPLSPSLSLALVQRVDWIQHSSVQLTSCYTWVGGWGVSIYLWVGVERYLHRMLYNHKLISLLTPFTIVYRQHKRKLDRVRICIWCVIRQVCNLQSKIWEICRISDDCQEMSWTPMTFSSSCKQSHTYAN